MEYDKDLLVETSRFLGECLESSPWRRYAPLFAREQVESEPALAEAFRESAELVATDFARFQRGFEAPNELFEQLLLAPSLLASYLYRLSRACFLRRVERAPDVTSLLGRWMTGVEIYYSAEIGPGLKLIHGLGTVIGAGCRVGSHFTCYQGVTLGDKLGAQTGPGARPVVGDHVIASAGSAILGPVEVGDWTVIGANAVVLHSLPGRCVAAGAPATVKAHCSEEQLQAFLASIKG